MNHKKMYTDEKIIDWLLVDYGLDIVMALRGVITWKLVAKMRLNMSNFLGCLYMNVCILYVY